VSTPVQYCPLRPSYVHALQLTVPAGLIAPVVLSQRWLMSVSP